MTQLGLSGQITTLYIKHELDGNMHIEKPLEVWGAQTFNITDICILSALTMEGLPLIHALGIGMLGDIEQVGASSACENG